MGKRKDIEEFILKNIKDIVKDDKDINLELYRDMFKKMNDKAFEEFMLKLQKGDILNLIVSEDMSKVKITTENNHKISKRLGYPLFQYTYTEGMDGLPPVRSLYKNYMLLLPVRRTKHTVTKGVSVSEDSKHYDTITGQPTGVSRSSKKSSTEAQLLISMGLDESVKEFMIDRSDMTKSSIMINALKKYGKVTSEVVDHYTDKRQTTNTLSAYLHGMHLDLNL